MKNSSSASCSARMGVPPGLRCRAWVDTERLLAVLGRVTARLLVLEGYAAQDADDLRGDEVRLGHLKYTFQTAIEACIAT